MAKLLTEAFERLTTEVIGSFDLLVGENEDLTARVAELESRVERHVSFTAARAAVENPG